MTALILGTNKGSLIFERGARGWKLVREMHLGITVSYAMCDPRTGTLWAALDTDHWGPKLVRSLDSGDTWVDVQTPQFPADSEFKPGKPAAVSYLWVVAPGGADEPQRLYVGTEPGGLFASDDGGETFNLVTSLWQHPSRQEQWFGGGRDDPGIHSILIDPRDSRRLLVGISVAGMFESLDAGQSWTPRNRGLKAPYLPDENTEVGHDPHLLAMCAAQPDALWQQNHVGIFRSVDGGLNWNEVSQPGGPAFFGFPIAAHAQHPDTAWVVPATSDEVRIAVERALCVCRTEDGGKTWSAFRSGLPQENCYDLVYRHGLDVRGDTVAIGSTTGSLFVSEDGGEHWQALAMHLPPVLSVRFMD